MLYLSNNNTLSYNSWRNYFIIIKHKGSISSKLEGSIWVPHNVLQYKFSRVQNWSSLNDLSIKIQFDFSIIIVLFAISPKCEKNIFATFFQGVSGFLFAFLPYLKTTGSFIGLSYLLRFLEGLGTAMAWSSALGTIHKWRYSKKLHKDPTQKTLINLSLSKREGIQ